MKTANESFENRWRNEQEYFPVPPGIDKERERKIYTCGWEDGVREYMNQAAADLAAAEERGRREAEKATVCRVRKAIDALLEKEDGK